MFCSKKGVASISQILILIIGIVAVSYAIGSEVRVVSGGPNTEDAIDGSEPQTTTSLPADSNSQSDDGDKKKEDSNPQSKKGEGKKEKGPDPPLESAGLFMKTISSGLFWAGVVATGIFLVAKIFKIDETYTNALTLSASAGIFVGSLAKAIGGKAGLGKLFGLIGYPTLIGIGVGIAVFLLAEGLTKKETRIVQFTCYPWEAPTGGNKCEDCNKQGILPCSEYQCRSLGQACQLVNPGTEEEKCVWVNRNDVNYPTIKTWKDALPNKNFTYSPDTSISPPDRGVKIEYTSKDKCIPAFTPLSFGIETNEPASCKIDYVKKNSFENMSFYFGGSQLLKQNHTQTISLPGQANLEAENITLENDNEYELSVRCRDANGNSNPANFIFKFCVDKGPDTTPPLIITTDLLNGMPVAYNQTSVELILYVNEPSNCKWDHLDQNYENMETAMTCQDSVIPMNAQMLYECTTTLTGLKDRFENNFYFKCKDKATTPNVNTESYKFTITGTQPLVINSVKPNGTTIRDSTDSVKVTLKAETSAGYNEGEAICYFSETGSENDYNQFFETNSHTHSQDLYLSEGDYEYFIKCVDLGGNSDLEKINFNVESDSEAPIVVRAYHEETYLKIITNEDGECVYGMSTCNYAFEDGIKMTDVDGTKHYTDWDTKTTFYIKCQDDYGNQPLPDECNIIVKGF